MTLTIFCPSNHLILDAPRCPECGWVRPRSAQTGQPLWGPLTLDGGLGGPGRSVLAAPAAALGVAVFPLREGQLVGVDMSSGRVRWRKPLEPGHMTRCLLADGERLIFSLSDERSLEQAGQGALYALDPLKGELLPLWNAGASLLSPPAITDKHILLRTSRSELVALTRQTLPQIVWRKPLRAWWALPPCPVGASVLIADGRAMQGEGVLLACSQSDGRLIWEQPTDGLLAYLPALVGEYLLVRDGRRALSCLELSSGKPLWKREYARIYSNLAACDGLAYLVVRGEAPSGQSGHYLLQALDPQANQVAWEAPLPGRARVLQAFDAQTLLLGDDDGLISAYDIAHGDRLWENSLGSDEDPVHTEFLINEGRLLAGTYFGQLVALQITAPAPPEADPAELLRQGDPLGAAASYAFKGDLRKAAEIYLGQLNDPEKARLLYESGGCYSEAGELAMRSGSFSKAQADFHQAGDLVNEAEALSSMGNSLAAGHLFEQSGKLERAAGEFEKGGELRSAMELYYRIGDRAGIDRLRPLVPFNLDDIGKLEQAGQLEEAGGAALKIEAWRRAADLFQRAGAPELELAALRRLAQSEGEAWAWERLAGLARKLGMFALEGEALLELDQDSKAAEAYMNAARQAEQRTPDQEETIAALFERAGQLFDCEGLAEPCQLCRQKVIYYRHLPWIVVEGHTEKGFREGEFNVLDLEIRNLGRGVAHEVHVHPDSARFEIDQGTTMVLIKHLGPGKTQPARIFLRPQKEQVGEAVPFMLIWTWQDRKDEQYEERSSTSVQVRRHGDSPSGGVPVNIHYHGTVYQAEEGNIEIVSGDKVAGDQVGGDKLTGGHKGDELKIDRTGGDKLSGGQKGNNVIIDRGGLTGRGVRIGTGPLGGADQQQTPCPNCDVLVKPGENFCQACGFELKQNGMAKP